MNLEQLGKRNLLLIGLLQQSQQWQKLDAQVKHVLPANLRPYFQVACIEEGCLVLLANNNMASSRLKMILPSLLPSLSMIHNGIEKVTVKVVPTVATPEKVNRLKLSETALSSFKGSADKLQDKHPELAQSLLNLVKNQRVK